jgi:hypothetical protein
MRRILNVDVYIDLICPWCLIGKSHLRRALERLAETDPDVDVRVRWHSVQLAPDVAAEGWPFAEFYERRLGGREAAQARQAQVRAAAAQAGVSIDFSRISIFPNSAKAHRLLAVGAPQLVTRRRIALRPAGPAVRTPFRRCWPQGRAPAPGSISALCGGPLNAAVQTAGVSCR